MTAPARLLCVTERLSTKGGADRYLVEVTAALASRGARASIIFGYADSTALDVAGAFAGATRFAPLERRVPHPTDDADARALRELVASHAADAILVQGVMSPAFLHALAEEPRAILVVQDHRVFCPARGKVYPDATPCTEPMGPACDRCFVEDGHLDVERRDLRLALTRERLRAACRLSRVVVLSHYMRQELVAEGVAPERVRVVPPPVSAWARRALHQAAVPPTCARSIAVPGRISWHKGSLHLLDAVAEAGLDAQVTYVGDGPGAGALAQRAEALDLAPRVSMTGWLPDDALAPALRAAGVVAIPSLWAEPYGIAGLEAGALGLPVVAHDVGAVGEWLEPGVTGLLVPPGDRRALAEALRNVLDDKGLASRLGTAARERANEHERRGAFATSWREMVLGD